MIKGTSQIKVEIKMLLKMVLEKFSRTMSPYRIFSDVGEIRKSPTHTSHLEFQVVSRRTCESSQVEASLDRLGSTEIRWLAQHNVVALPGLESILDSCPGCMDSKPCGLSFAPHYVQQGHLMVATKKAKGRKYRY